MAAKKSSIKEDKLEFICYAPKPHGKPRPVVRITAEAMDVIEGIYLKTNIPLLQIASEMIMYASKHVTIGISPAETERKNDG